MYEGNSDKWKIHDLKTILVPSLVIYFLSYIKNKKKIIIKLSL